MAVGIPKVIDGYNHHMNGVDIADQLRLYYATHRTSRRAWMPILFWLIDTAIIKSFKIGQLKFAYYSQRIFRDKLVWQLINSTKIGESFSKIPDPMIPRVYVTKNYELNEKRLSDKFDHMPVAIEE
jgi:hypothetical protein